MPSFYRQNSCSAGAAVFLTMLFMLLPVAANPRDDRIRALQVQIEEQQLKLEELRKAVEALRSSPPRLEGEVTPAGTTISPYDPPSKSAVPEGLSAPSAADVSSVDPADDDPGPEPPPPLKASPSGQGVAAASGLQPLLNPNISVIGLMEGKAGGAVYDPSKDSFYLREIELALQAPIDPYARADIYLSFAQGESPEVEEATLTWTGLPAGLQAKAGVLKADFGRINPLHSHALPQIDMPLPNQAIFGPESLHNPGVELSWLAPTPWYSRWSFQALSRSFGPDVADASFLPGAPPLSGAELVERLRERENFAAFPSGGGKGLIYLGRWENLWDLNEDTTLQLGLSGATSSVRGGNIERSLAYGADLTLKWHPLANPHRSLVWQSEFLRLRQNFSLGRRDFGGWSTFLNYQWSRNWAAGLRYDMSELPFDSSCIQRRGTAMLEWIPSEFSRLRLQYNLNTFNYQPSFSEVLLQWNIVLGPHGAHKY